MLNFAYYHVVFIIFICKLNKFTLILQNSQKSADS